MKNPSEPAAMTHFQFTWSTADEEAALFSSENPAPTSSRLIAPIVTPGVYRIINDALYRVVGGAPILPPEDREVTAPTKNK